MNKKVSEERVYKMTRDEAIKIIGNLFPADDEHRVEAANTGKRLLEQAKKEVNLGWRDEPTEVLIRYASLCLEIESKWI